MRVGNTEPRAVGAATVRESALATRPRPVTLSDGRGSMSSPDTLIKLAADLAGVPADAVELAETHISRVALAGPPGGGVALKQCKAVDFGFVDLAAPAARRAALEKERAVNDRFAPGVYRGMRELPGGEPVLDMRRLDAADGLDRLAADAVGDGHERLETALPRVVDALVPLFAASRSDAETAAFGDPAVLRRNLTENHDALFAAERDYGLDLPAGAVRCRQLTLLALLEPELRERAAGGFVRDGHGDLRCEHIYLTGDGVKVLDGIAFNERLRCVDVADEFCFLASDLTRLSPHAGCGTALEFRHAQTLLRLYRERTGDPVSERLTGFYRSYRFAVRAKVVALSEPPWEANPAYGRPWVRVLADFALAAADDALHGVAGHGDLPAKGPVAVAVGGRSGSGKSTLAAAVADRLGAFHLRTDVIRKRLFDVAENDPLPPAAYESTASARTYAALVDAATAGPHADERTVVADATFLRADDRRQFAGAFDGAAALLFVWCHCDDAVAERRLAARAAEGTDASDADVGVRRRQAVGLGRGDAPGFEEFPHVLRLNTDAPVEQLCDRVIDALRVAAGVRRQ